MRYGIDGIVILDVAVDVRYLLFCCTLPVVVLMLLGTLLLCVRYCVCCFDTGVAVPFIACSIVTADAIAH
jgi:hypothetical protein